MDDFDFDTSDYESMDSFIKRIRDIAEAYYKATGQMLDENAVYHELRRYGLKPQDWSDSEHLKDVSDFFKHWVQDYSHGPGLRVFVSMSWPHFCQFKSSDELYGYEFLKLYIPLDHEHLERGAEELFTFLEEQGIVHESKIARVLRSDNVVVRLSKKDVAGAKKILDFVAQNQYLQEGLNPNNPFIPTVGGVGIMSDRGGSYNYSLATAISQYIQECILENKPASLSGFAAWFGKNASRYSDSEGQDLVSTFLNVLNNGPVEQVTPLGDKFYVDNPEQLNEEWDTERRKKAAILLDAVKATYIKGGPKALARALSAALHSDDYSLFERGDDSSIDYQVLLKENVCYWDLLDFIWGTISLSGYKVPQPRNHAELAVNYVAVLFKDDLALRLDEICAVTVEKYGSDKLQSAIEQYLSSNDPRGFARFDGSNNDVNYRERLSQYSPAMITSSIERSLHNRGIDTSNMTPERMVEVYSDVLERERYAKASQTPKLK